jgi:glycosyltransferase involved in cell wall biosynthesis
MRLLFLTPFPPDPRAPHGGGAYLGHVLGALAKQAEVGVLALANDEEMGRWQSLDPSWRWRAAVPSPARPHSWRRVPHTLRMLWRWRRLPLVAAKVAQPALRDSIARALAEFRPDVALIELAQMAQFLPLLRSVRTVLTDHEAGCPANTTTGLGERWDRRDRELWRRYVLRLYPQADLLQAVTTEDAQTLRAMLQRPVAVRPPTVEQPAQPAAPAAAGPRALFLGDYRHRPNSEAAERLAREVFPLVRAAVPAAELWLAGSSCDRIEALGSLPGVQVRGFAPDLPDLFRHARLLLAPVWSGGGFRMKGITALAHGVPVVTNALGARGSEAPAAARVVAEDVRALAAAAARWLTDAGAAGAAGRAAYAWVRDHLSPHAVATQQLERLQELLASPRR